MCTDTWKKQG